MGILWAPTGAIGCIGLSLIVHVANSEGATAFLASFVVLPLSTIKYRQKIPTCVTASLIVRI